MAVTGLFFVFFVLLHMYGNLQILISREAFDEYAHHLRTFGEPMLPYAGFLWVLRIALIAAVIGHVWSALRLWQRAGAARTTKYQGKKGVTYGGFYAKAMRWGGLAILFFVVFHILHFTTHTINIGGAQDTGSARVIASFTEWWAVGIYLLAMIFLGMHLLHGIFAACMTLGFNTSLKRAEQIRFAAHLVATIIVVGFMIPPLAILFGFVD